MSEEVTIRMNDTAVILENIEIFLSACNAGSGKAVVMVTEFGQDKVDAVQAGDLLVFHRLPVWVRVLGVYDQSIQILVGQTTVH